MVHKVLGLRKQVQLWKKYPVYKSPRTRGFCDDMACWNDDNENVEIRFEEGWDYVKDREAQGNNRTD